MLDIIIVTIGKLREDHYAAACGEYLKRLQPFARIKVQELKAESFGKKNREEIIQLECRRLEDYLNKLDNAEVFLLDKSGKEYSSEAFAEKLDKLGAKKIVFVIGGSLGLDLDVLVKYNNRLSMSPMTWPHELARTMLLEQIYRAVTIINKKTYHY